MARLFITNCVIKHIFHVVPGGHYERMYGQDFNPNAYGLMKSCADHIALGGRRLDRPGDPAIRTTAMSAAATPTPG